MGSLWITYSKSHNVKSFSACLFLLLSYDIHEGHLQNCLWQRKQRGGIFPDVKTANAAPASELARPGKTPTKG